MLNNITNFFNLIKSGMTKTQLESSDLLPIGTRDGRYGGNYKPATIKYSDLVAGLVGGSNGQVLFNDSGTIAGASNLYWDKINQRVGIGTSTPTFTLDALGPQYGGFRFMADGSTFLRLDTTTTNFQISHSNTETSLTTGNYGPLYFINNGGGQIRLSLFANGNFAIGTTTDAGYKLDVNGTARALNNLIVYGDGTSAATRGTLTIQSLGETHSGRLVFSRNYSNWYNQIETIGSGGGANLGLAINDSGTYSLVTNKGKVFIGNSLTIPTTATLQVGGAGNTSATTSLLVQNSASTELFIVRDDGNVGIGTSTPAEKLDIHNQGKLRLGTSNTSFFSTINTDDAEGLVINTNYVKTSIRFSGSTVADFKSTGIHLPAAKKIFGESDFAFLDLVEGGSANTKLWNYYAYNIILGTNNAERLRLTSNGNFLINTTTDAGYRLDVNGTSNFRDVARFDSAGNNKRVLISSNASNSYISMFGDVGGYITSSSDIRLSPTTGNIWINEAWYIGSFPSIDTYGAVGIRGQYAKAMYFENNSLDQYVSGFIFNYSGSGGFNSSSGLFKVLWNNQSRLQMNTNGNLMINTTTDAGFKLDINGSTRIGNSTTDYGTTLLTLTSNQGTATFKVGTGTLYTYQGFQAVNGAIGSDQYINAPFYYVNTNVRIITPALDWIGIADRLQTTNPGGSISAKFGTFGTAYATLNASAQVEIASTTKGFLPPRMTSAQKTAIATPAAGLMVYDTDLNRPCFYNGSSWITL